MRGFVAVLTGVVSTVALGVPSTRAWEGGNTAPLATLADATGLETPSAIAIHNNLLYVTNQEANSVTVYPANWTDLNTAPIKILQGTATGLRQPTGIAFHNNEMYITEDGRYFSNTTLDRVLVFPADWASGNTAPTRILTGAATGLNSPSGIAFHNNVMYITNKGGNSVTAYDVTASANTAPIRTLNGADTDLSKPSDIAFHNAKMYITNQGPDFNYLSNDSVTAYDVTASANTAPLDKITGLRYPHAIAFGTGNCNGRMYVAQGPPLGRVYVFDANWVGGNDTRIEELNNNVGLVFDPESIAIDASCRVYLANNNSVDTITVYEGTGWNFGTVPIRVLGQSQPEAVAFDTSGRMYVSHPTSNSIRVYAADWVDGNTAPIKTLFGPNTKLDSPVDIAFHNNEMYVANSIGGTITVYAADWVNGNTAPSRILVPSINVEGIAIHNNEMFIIGWDNNGNVVQAFDVTASARTDIKRTLDLFNPGSIYAKAIAFDSNDRMYVLNTDNQQSVVKVYQSTVSGSASPIKTLSGANTGLGGARGIAFDSNDQMYVTNLASANGSVMVYAADWANGNTAPIKTLVGTQLNNNTGLGEPRGIAFDSNGRMYVTNKINFFVLPKAPHSVTMYGDRPSVSPSAPTPFTPVFTISIDHAGGSCGGTNSGASIGYRYLPAATECTRPGYTFSGWARASSPTTPLELPLIIDPSDGVLRYFIAESADLVAIWTKQPEPPVAPQVFGTGKFFCTRCTATWLFWLDPPGTDATSTYTITADHAGNPIRFRFGPWNIAIFTGLTPRSTHTYGVSTTTSNTTSTSTNITITLGR